MSVTTIKPITQSGVPQPIYRFSSDLSTVMGNRPSTFGSSGLGSGVSSGYSAGDGLMLEDSDGDDFILLESDTGSGSNYIELEN